MATDLSSSFNEKFMNINNKLKKRFMRKPNLSEATNEFVALAIQCEHSEQPSFAGHCYIGAAKCEATAGNILNEAEHYISAARQFMEAEKKLHSLKFESPDRENLEASIGCFIQALNKYPDKSPLRSAIYLELANNLKILDLKHEALSYYEQALQTVESKVLELKCLNSILNLQIECGHYDNALKTANKIADYNLPESYKAEINVSRVLLALIVCPEEDSKPESLQKLVNCVLNEEETADIPVSMDLKIKLQSIIICHTTSDFTSLVKVAADCKRFLTNHQRILLDVLATQDRVELDF